MILLIISKIHIISYREKLRDWPVETSATNLGQVLNPVGLLPKDERE